MKAKNLITKLTLLRRAPALAAGVLLTGGTLVGQTIQNPSFELDAFSVAPGYVSNNAPITGWMALPTSRVGLNPAGGQSPFANTGRVPDGTNVAFLQSGITSASVLGTTITDLTPGQNYKVSFRVNARTGADAAGTPVIKVGVDNQPLMSFNMINVAGINPYQYAAFDFLASATSHSIYFTNDTPADATALFDNFTVAAMNPGWSYSTWTDDTSSGVDGTKKYTHAYNFGGGAAPNTTINGILFTGVPGGNIAVSNAFRINGMGSTFNSDEANVISSGTDGSAALMKRFIYGGNPGNLVIHGLTPGVEYVATLYSAAWETGYRVQSFYVGNDRLTVNQDAFGDNAGIRISYRYIAPASGSIILNWAPHIAASSLHLYGFSNYEVTSPGAPIITAQPRSHTVTSGSAVAFQVYSGGAEPLTYQWYHSGNVLLDATNRVLTIANVTSGEAGAYEVVVANASGSVTSAPAALTLSGPIANPSFEEDLFLNYPGYASLNTLISGWAANDTARVGINPMFDGLSAPFGNNGTIPSGSQVAFMQSVAGAPKTLSTILDGLTPGQKYTMSFQINARSGQNVTAFNIGVDGESVVDMQVSSVGGTNAFRRVAFDFTAASATPVLWLTNASTGDNTVLLDEFQIAPSVSQWSYEPWNDDSTSGVDPARNYSHAYNFGGAGVSSDTVVNGIRFRGVPGANPSAPGQFWTTNLTGAFGADANQIVTAGGGSARLAQSFIYFAGTIGVGAEQTIVISNLVPGVEYQASLFLVGFGTRNPGRAATFRAGQDRMTINEHHFGNDAGIRVNYRYVAGPNGTMSLAYEPIHSPSSIHTYGFMNAEVASTNAPVVYRAPVSRTVSAGATIVLDALVGGQGPLSYQWQREGVALPDQTNAVLTLIGLTIADMGTYTLVVSNAQGVTTASTVVEVGLPLVNSSFEADTFATAPGYISGNAPITGWTASIATGAGLNPVSTGASDFANNGIIPDGTKVAFIQADGGTLSQVITGLTAGATYFVKYSENARLGYPAPLLGVTFGGQVIVPTHAVNPGAYRRVSSASFLATSDTAELVFTKSAGPVAGDSAALIDMVAVLEQAPSGPVFVAQPQSVFAREGENITLSALVQGTMPISLQWLRNGEEMAGMTGLEVPLPGIQRPQAGRYELVASNSLIVVTSQVAVVRVGLHIAELFSTGLDFYGGPLTTPALDPHYTLIASPDPVYTGPTVYAGTNVPAPQYLPNNANSQWISPGPNTYAKYVEGVYIYRTSFLLDTLDPATAQIEGAWGMDNFGWDIRINGTSLGFVNNVGFGSLSTFVITNGFIAGSNTLDFVISNAPPPDATGLRVELKGLAEALPPAAPQILVQPASQVAQELTDVSFTVMATGSPALTYQWYFEGIDLPNETNRTLRLTRISPLDQQGSYWVVIANPEGTIESQAAMLTVNMAPEANIDRIATAVDQGVTFPVAKLLFNDAEYEGDALSVVGVSTASLLGGSVSMAGGMITYTPAAGFSGEDQFTYLLGDARGGRATGTVMVSVGATVFLQLNGAPVLQSDGHFRFGYTGVSGYIYTVERATNVLGPWEVITNVVADGEGKFQVDDSNDPPAPTRFYRVTYP